MKIDSRLGDKIDRLGVGEGIVFMNFAKEYIEPFIMKIDPSYLKNSCGLCSNCLRTP